MKLKDFLKEEIDVDVKGSLTDDWIIAFVGPVKLTKAGEEMFAEILDNEVHYSRTRGFLVDVADEVQDALARKLFEYAAGYCPCETYDTLFMED